MKVALCTLLPLKGNFSEFFVLVFFQKTGNIRVKQSIDGNFSRKINIL